MADGHEAPAPPHLSVLRGKRGYQRIVIRGASLKEMRTAAQALVLAPGQMRRWTGMRISAEEV